MAAISAILGQVMDHAKRAEAANGIGHKWV